MKKTISKKQILQFLRQNPVMAAAVCSKSTPISTVLLFAVTDDFSLYFVTRENSFKAQALADNPLISITNWVLNEFLVQATGNTEAVTDMVEQEKFLDIITQSVDKVENFWPPVLSVANGNYVVYKVSLTWIRALDLSNLKVTENDPPYTEYTFKR